MSNILTRIALVVASLGILVVIGAVALRFFPSSARVEAPSAERSGGGESVAQPAVDEALEETADKGEAEPLDLPAEPSVSRLSEAEYREMRRIVQFEGIYRTLASNYTMHQSVHSGAPPREMDDILLYMMDVASVEELVERIPGSAYQVEAGGVLICTLSGCPEEIAGPGGVLQYTFSEDGASGTPYSSQENQRVNQFYQVSQDLRAAYIRFEEDNQGAYPTDEQALCQYMAGFGTLDEMTDYPRGASYTLDPETGLLTCMLFDCLTDDAGPDGVIVQRYPSQGEEEEVLPERDGRKEQFEANHRTIVSNCTLYMAANNGQPPKSEQDICAYLNGFDSFAELAGYPSGASYHYDPQTLTVTSILVGYPDAAAEDYVLTYVLE